MAPKPLIVIVGPTASGKTAVAVEIAKEAGGEIICADSRTVYRGMDIGTAKPTVAEQAEVPHWGIDIVDPDQRFTAADFQSYALQKIEEIRGRGNVPLLVGGTGLYTDSIVFDYKFGPEPDMYLRQQYESMSVEQLQKYCIENNIKLPENNKNKRYLIRAIEQKSVNNKRLSSPIANTIIVGITTERDILKDRITTRAEKLFDAGVVDEAAQLGDKYGWDHKSMTGNIYPLCRSYINGDISFDELTQRFITLDWRLAKRQLTWLKRNRHIHWMPLNDIRGYVIGLLDSEQKS